MNEVDYLERFWDKVEADPFSGCWTFNSMERSGYGRIKINGKIFSAHRFIFELLNGKIPRKFELDHLCRNRACINPYHLEIVTRRENVLRGNSPQLARERQLAKRFCKFGHPFNDKNTRIRSNGARVCRKCDSELHSFLYHNRIKNTEKKIFKIKKGNSCLKCNSKNIIKYGFYPARNNIEIQKYQCRDCLHRFVLEKLIIMRFGR